jgi:hydrogenase expression/formation protein HypD
MRYLDEYRDGNLAAAWTSRIAQNLTRSWRIMEICGGQTHSIVRFGLDQILPEGIELLHGPGCPVCVTPLDLIDKAIQLAGRAEVILCSFGDMLRVPGSKEDLFSAKASGGDVRMVYSPLDAVRMARENPTREVVFFAVGFETTAPANALAVEQASQEGIGNFSLLVSQVRVPPAMDLLLASPSCRIDGFLAAGHVCSVMGTSEYPALAEKYRVPIVITGFEPVDLLQGISLCVDQLETGRHEVVNPYSRAVSIEGNVPARDLLEKVFETGDREWRGIGVIPDSGLFLREEYAGFDAEKRFDPRTDPCQEATECRSGQVLQGLLKPFECPAFGTRCTPENPLGATMVSAEGACAAYYEYGNH